MEFKIPIFGIPKFRFQFLEFQIPNKTFWISNSNFWNSNSKFQFQIPFFGIPIPNSIFWNSKFHFLEFQCIYNLSVQNAKILGKTCNIFVLLKRNEKFYPTQHHPFLGWAWAELCLNEEKGMNKKKVQTLEKVNEDGWCQLAKLEEINLKCRLTFADYDFLLHPFIHVLFCLVLVSIKVKVISECLWLIWKEHVFTWNMLFCYAIAMYI